MTSVTLGYKLTPHIGSELKFDHGRATAELYWLWPDVSKGYKNSPYLADLYLANSDHSNKSLKTPIMNGIVFCLKVFCKIHLGYLTDLAIVRAVSQSAQYLTLYTGNSNFNTPDPQTVVLGTIAFAFSILEIILDVMEEHFRGWTRIVSNAMRGIRIYCQREMGTAHQSWDAKYKYGILKSMNILSSPCLKLCMFVTIMPMSFYTA